MGLKDCWPKRGYAGDRPIGQSRAWKLHHGRYRVNQTGSRGKIR
jgi:hypothetical protein